MDSLIDNLGRLIVNYPSFKYLILAIGTIIQGEVTILVSTYLIINKILSWKEFLITTPLALFIFKSFIYFNGKIIRHSRFGWRFHQKIKASKNFKFYLFYLKKNFTKFFIISNFLPTTNFIFVFLAGWLKTPWSQFAKSFLISLFIWFSVMTTIAYFIASGLYFLKDKKILTKIELIIGIILLLVIATEFIAKKILKKFIKAYYEK